MNRRNYPIGLRRGGWTKRRKGYTDVGLQLRSIDKWERTFNINLHITKFNEMEIVLYVKKQMFHIPLMTVIRGELEVMQ